MKRKEQKPEIEPRKKGEKPCSLCVKGVGKHHKTCKFHEKKTPLRAFKQIIQDSGDPGYINRVMVATPTTGDIRMEWAAARYGQIIPTNWSMVAMIQWMNSFIPIHYSVADAQNLIVGECLAKDFEWLLLVEHDTMPPEDAFVRFNKYMRDGDVPVVSGLYYTRSVPSEPMMYRGRGSSYVTGWKLGDKVWVDGVPTGMLLIHTSILKAIWKDSPEYIVNGKITRRVFKTPADMWFNEETGTYNTVTGTSDLDWCSKIIDGDYFRKAGWHKIAKKKYPFLIDTNIFCRHIDKDGTQYPTEF